MTSSTAVRMKVVRANALEYETEVLALKWAQGPYGADAAAFRELQSHGMVVSQSDMPGDGLYRTFPGVGRGPQHFLFVGTPPLSQFGYSDIRSLARRSLVAVMIEFPDLRRVALTLHGPGIGLDELASFEEELQGVLDGIAIGEAPRGLEEVAFVEQSRGRAERMDEFLRGYLSGDGAGAVVTPEGAAALGERGSVGNALADRPTAFVAMPFADEFEDTYSLGIQEVLHELGYKCERIDQVAFVGDVVAEMRSRIQSSAIVVADLTGANPNVYLEVGFAWASDVPTVLVARQQEFQESLRFDVQGQRCLQYKSIVQLKERLRQEVSSLRAAGSGA